MDDTATSLDDTATSLQEKLDQLLHQAAEVSVTLDRVQGTIVGVLHYSVIEKRAHELGRQLSREVQTLQMGSLAGGQDAIAKCPECGTRCQTVRKKCSVTSIDGPLRIEEPIGRCPTCRRDFFPPPGALGFDARQFTPLLVKRVIVAAAEARSFKRAAIVIDRVGGQPVSAKTIERVVHDVGGELATRRDADPKTADALAQSPESPPELAVVECDGGRIRTREPGRGPGVHLSEKGWSESKNACLIRASPTASDHDPQPEPPACFRDPRHVAKLAEAQALSVAAATPNSSSASAREADSEAEPEEPLSAADWRPRRLVRTVLGSIACSQDLGKQMDREARRRRFGEAKIKAFLGDGLPWNWSIWKAHFEDFTPILDFIHVLSYLFMAAKAVHDSASDAWDQYLAWMRGAWQGEVAQVLEELREWRRRRGEPPDEAADADPRVLLARTITYLENNRDRMRYPEYRQAGMPVTTAWMESLVKEMNYRVKGTEMFWNDPEGAEAILQVRATALCDDERLDNHPGTRPGCPFTRRPILPKIPLEKIKS